MHVQSGPKHETIKEFWRFKEGAEAAEPDFYDIIKVLKMRNVEGPQGQPDAEARYAFNI